jgi:hypothetical protein
MLSEICYVIDPFECSYTVGLMARMLHTVVSKYIHDRTSSVTRIYRLTSEFNVRACDLMKAT